MKICAFTICSQNYYGIARTLRESFIRNNSEADFFIILVDSDDNNGVDYVLSAKEIMNIEENIFLDMAFKYDVTEFCTAVKPYGFGSLFTKGYEKVVYLDPDILVFDSLDEVWDNDASIYLTPHITEIKPKIHNEWPQEFFLKFGIFNCGFVGVSNDTNGRIIVDWWKEKLKDLSYSDIEIGIFTDQKWMEFVFNFVELSKICVIKNLGYDMAPWNFSERKIYKENQVYKVIDPYDLHATNRYVLAPDSAYATFLVRYGIIGTVLYVWGNIKNYIVLRKEKSAICVATAVYLIGVLIGGFSGSDAMGKQAMIKMGILFALCVNDIRERKILDRK